MVHCVVLSACLHANVHVHVAVPGSDRDVPLINSSLLYNVASWPVTNIHPATAAAFTHPP